MNDNLEAENKELRQQLAKSRAEVAHLTTILESMQDIMEGRYKRLENGEGVTLEQFFEDLKKDSSCSPPPNAAPDAV